jgi:hypothetical protein
VSGPPVLSGRALALALLGWSLVRVLARMLFTRQEAGLTLFNANYGGEGLSSIDKEERESLDRFSGCIACGRCDVGEGERMAASHGAYPGLMQLTLASTRSMPDYDAALLGFAHVPEHVLQEKQRVCPADIPFAELAAFVRAHAPSPARALGEEA